MAVQFVDYNDCEAAKALAEILTDMKNASFITKDIANQLYSNGLEAIRHVLCTAPDRVTFEAAGRLLAFRNHRNTWTLWGRVAAIKMSRPSRKRPYDSHTVSYITTNIPTPKPIKIFCVSEAKDGQPTPVPGGGGGARV